MELTKNFANSTYTYLPREDSQFADALLDSMIYIPNGIHSMPLSVEKREKLIGVPLKYATLTLLFGITTFSNT